MKVYLEEPIELYGIKVTHTRPGLEYLIGHYEKMLTMRPEAREKKVEEHMIRLIENWKQHLELYKKQEDERKVSM